MKNNVVSDELIKKYLSGHASPEEASFVGDWISQDQSNLDYMLKIESRVAEPLSKQDIQMAKKEVWEKVVAERSAKKREFSFYKIAAIISFVIACSSILYFVRVRGNDPIYTSEALGDIKAVTMPDQSALTLNRNSHIQWNAEFNKNERNVTMHGQVFFDVVHDPQKPFVINVDNLKIKVLGTAFDVFEDTVSDQIVVSVTRGKVMMMNANENLIVEAGMKGIYRKLQDDFLLEKLSGQNELGYATHSITFSEASFSEVARQLDRAYGVTCVFDEKDFTNCRLTTSWSNKPLPFVLNIISEALNIEYKQEGNRVYFYGKGCL